MKNIKIRLHKQKSSAHYAKRRKTQQNMPLNVEIGITQ